MTVMLDVRTGWTTAFVVKKSTVFDEGATVETLPSASFQLDAAFMSGLRFPQTSISQVVAAGSTTATKTETRSRCCFMAQLYTHSSGKVNRDQQVRIAYLTVIVKCESESFHQVTFCVTPDSHVPTSSIFSGRVFVAPLNVNVALDAVAAYARQAS